VAASPEEFAEAVRSTAQCQDVDALVVVFVPPIAMPAAVYAKALREAATGKPVVTTFLAVEGVPDELAVPGPDGSPSRGSVPSYPSPERAVSALVRATRYAQWRSRPRGEFVRPEGIDTERARELVLKTSSDEDVVALLACYGIEVVPFRTVSTVDSALAACEELGFPVVLKSTSEQLRHRTDFLGVRLDLASVEAVRVAYQDLVEVSGSTEMYVQRMAPKGVSCQLGLQDDPSFGTLVSFGLGGVVSDLLGDRAYRAVPMTDVDAAALVRAPKAAPLLAGYRGGRPADLAALEDLALRLSALAEDLPEVRRLVLEPVLASAAGAYVSSARITVGEPPSQSDTGPRRLRQIITD
jgi:acyl-CoA synthetase (NDP forming)